MNRIPVIIGAIVLVVAVVIVLVITTASGNKKTDPTSSPTPSAITSQSADTAPTGCLGGRNRDAAMLLAAQKAAPHTTNGAIEVATALVRWTFRSPIFDAQEAIEVSNKVIASTATPEFKDLAGGAAANPNNSGGVVPDGTPFYLSTAQGVWYLDSTTSNEVKVSIGAAYVVNGAVSPQLRSSTTVDMVWETGGWHAKSGSITRTTEELFKIGTGFTGGC
jgi:hypothetical protein